MNVWQVAVQVICLILMCEHANSQEWIEVKMNTQQQLYDTRLVKALELAIKKARDLGYQIERMKIALSISNNICTLYFEEQPELNHAIIGGDLTIKLEIDTLRIIEFERGQ